MAANYGTISQVLGPVVDVTFDDEGTLPPILTALKTTNPTLGKDENNLTLEVSLHIGENTVTFRWKDRSDHNRTKQLTLSGEEFVRRYLRHVLPQGLRSIRYYGFCHPTAKAKRMRVQFHSGTPVEFGAAAAPVTGTASPHQCPKCGDATRLLMSFRVRRRGRGPPADLQRSTPASA